MIPSLDNFRVVSLDRRPRRRRSFFARLPSHIQGGEVFPAVDGKTLELDPEHTPFCGTVGCFASHVELFKQERAANRTYVAVFEDDAIPSEHHVHLDSLFAELDDEKWDFLHLGVGCKNPLPGKRWGRLPRGAVNTHAYIANWKFMDRFLQRFAPPGRSLPYGPPIHVDRAFMQLAKPAEGMVWLAPESPLFLQDKGLPKDVKWGQPKSYPHWDT